jgi:hypothetical protein
VGHASARPAFRDHVPARHLCCRRRQTYGRQKHAFIRQLREFGQINGHSNGLGTARKTSGSHEAAAFRRPDHEPQTDPVVLRSHEGAGHACGPYHLPSPQKLYWRLRTACCLRVPGVVRFYDTNSLPRLVENQGLTVAECNGEPGRVSVLARS